MVALIVILGIIGWLFIGLVCAAVLVATDPQAHSPKRGSNDNFNVIITTIFWPVVMIILMGMGITTLAHKINISKPWWAFVGWLNPQALESDIKYSREIEGEPLPTRPARPGPRWPG